MSTKASQTFSVSRVINAPAEKVWSVIGESYGDIEKYHPDIVESSYGEGFTKGGEGAERISFLNEGKTKVVFERQLDYDPENFSFTSQTIRFKGAAMDPEGTYMRYRIEPINATSCRLVGDMSFRMKPAFLGWIFKGTLREAGHQHFIAIEHFVTTDEPVNKQNLNAVFSQYK